MTIIFKKMRQRFYLAVSACGGGNGDGAADTGIYETTQTGPWTAL